MLGVSQTFFSLLQKNVLDRRHRATREDLRIAIVRWIVSWSVATAPASPPG
jgi:hypothetical protein